jgi:enoyl-CoA hydratase
MSSSHSLETVRLASAGPHIRIIELARPEVLNAMSIQLCLDLEKALDIVGRDNQCRVVILTGAGRSFCSGLDLKDHSVIPDIDGLTVPRIGPRAIRIYSRVVPAMRHLPKPIIAAARSAVFNATGIVNGLTSTELGVSWILPRLIGAAHSNDLLLTGRRIDADEALRMGLVSRVVDDDAVRDEAIAMAEAISAFSPYGVEMTKQVIWANLETASLAAGIEIEDRNQIMLGMTDNLPEAISAFADKREPVYTDEPRRGIYPKD